MRRMKLAGGLEGAGSLLSGFSAAIVQKVRSSWAPSTPLTPGLLLRPIPVSLVIALLGAFCAMPALGAPAASITTTLALTSGGSATTSVSQGTVVTLTATVMAGGAPVHPGLVEFCDASGAACTDVHPLNTTGLNGSGVATFSLVPGPGNHSYKAVFLTAGVKHTSTSTTLPLTVTPVTTTVTPPLPTYTLMSVSGPASYSTFTGAVSGFVPYSALPPYPSPTGTVSFLDITNGSAPVATGSLSGNVLGSGLGPASLIATANPSGVAVADLNGDGIPDVVAENSAPGTVSVFLGNGDGTFKTAVIYGAGGIGYGAGGLGYPDVISIGDFNGDGIPDIVTVNDGSPGAIAVLTGRGDGTFNTAVTTNLGASNYFYIFVADLNQDGLEDLIITGPSPNGTGSGFTEYLSNGDGTFRQKVAYVNTGFSISVGDFNGDGNLDLLYENPSVFQNSLSILPGLGDGTFGPAQTISGTYLPGTAVVADFNGDGFADIALVSADNFVVSLFLGNGDGTFQAPVTSAVNRTSGFNGNVYPAAADMNYDGILDLVLVDASGSWVALGNGDGTFQALVLNPLAASGYDPFVFADLNGDGYPDLVRTATDNNQISIQLSGISITASGSSPAGVPLFGVGQHSIAGAYTGDGNFTESTSANVSVTNSIRYAGTLTLAANPATGTTGQPVSLTATLSPYYANFPTDGETITFLNGTKTIGTAKLSGGAATIVTSTLPAGVDSLTATYPGDTSYLSVNSDILPFPQQPSVTVNSLTIDYTGYNGYVPTVTTNPTGLTPTFTFVGTGATTYGPSTTAPSAIGTYMATAVVTTGGVSNSASGTLTITPTTTSTTLAQTYANNGVSLTATVTAKGTNGYLNGGQVEFCDATAASCTGSHLLGVAQVGTSRTAEYNFHPGIGSHSYKAIFLQSVGPNSYNLSSTSNTVPVVISGTYYSSATIAQSGAAGNYTLTGTVSALANMRTVPAATGTLSFLDTSDTNYVLGSASLGSATGATQTFLSQGSNAVKSAPSSIAAGDFNGDGIPDLVVANTGSNNVSVLLGTNNATTKSQLTYVSNGSFQPATVVATGKAPVSVAVGDFNGDGVADVAVANSGDNTVTVLNSTGAGAMKSSSVYATGSNPAFVLAADVNGDGFPDLVVANSNDNTISVLFGTISGTFKSQVTYPTGNSPVAIAAGDFNGDGIVDLAVANNDDNDVTILLGNGDGTFQPGVAFPTGDGPQSVAVTDLNGDGELDLAVANSFDDTVSVLLGNGDGTFQTQQTYDTGFGAASVVAADFDGDGNQDVAVANGVDDNVSILLGVGDGTLQPQVEYLTDWKPGALVVADFNGDGVPDLATANACGSDSTCASAGSASVLLSQIEVNATATATHISPVGGISSVHNVTASYSGDSNYVGAVSSPTGLNGGPPVPTTLSLRSPQSYGIQYQAVTLIATLSPLMAQNYNSNGETVTFLSGNTTVGRATLTGGVATLTTTSLQPGTDNLTAKFATDGKFGASVSPVYPLLVKTSVAITLGNLSQTYTGSPLSVSVTANPTGPVINVTYNGSATPPTKPGSYAVAATITDPNYWGNASATLVIAPAQANITVTAYNLTYDGLSHKAAGTATGIGGVNLAADLNVTSTTHTNAGTYGSDTWTFTDPNGIYASASATISDIIGQATPNVNVTGYTVTYDGQPHTAFGIANGVGGVNLTADLNMSGTTHTNAGTYLSASSIWTFSDPSGNYTTARGGILCIINKATPTIVVTPYNVIYDGLVHTAPATATGAGGANLLGSLTLTGTNHIQAGTYATDGWSFTDPNYTSASGTVSDVISQATASITVTPYMVTYDGSPHSATATAAGVGSTNLIADVNLTGTTHTNAGTYAGDTWTFTDPSGNYVPASGTVSDCIKQAKATISVTPYSLTYDGTAHTAAATATGLGAANLITDLNLSGTTHTNAGTYATDGWSFSDPAGNYANASGAVSDAIAQATATLSVVPYSVSYDGTAHTAAGTATGVGGANLIAGLNLTGTTHTSSGTYPTDAWTFADAAGNYVPAAGSVSDQISQAPEQVTLGNLLQPYNGSPLAVTTVTSPVSGLAISVTYSGAGATTYSASATPPTAPGSYAVAATVIDPNFLGSGTGTLVILPPSITASSPFAGFGSQAIGSVSSPQTITISLTAESVASIAILTQGASALDFTDAGSTTCVPQYYGLPSTCVVSVQFAPKAAGLRLGAVVLFDAAGNQLINVPLYGVGSGAEVAYSPSTTRAIAPSVSSLALTAPSSVLVDGAGNQFIADPGNNRIVLAPAGGGAATAISPTVNGLALSAPRLGAIDGAGDLFIVDTGNNRIILVPAGGGAAIAISPTVNGLALSSPSALAVDGAGDLFIADALNSRVVEVPANGGSSTAIAPTVGGTTFTPAGLALDGAGDLFISDPAHNRIIEVPAGGGTATANAPTASGVGLNKPQALAIDAAGDLFIADSANNRVVEVPATGASIAISPTASGASLAQPSGVALDAVGDLFIADQANNRVVEVVRSQAPVFNFPSSTVDGHTDTADGTKTAQMVNIGNQNLTVSSVAYAPDFKQASGDSAACTGSSVLTPGLGCDVPVIFAPLTTGTPLSESVTITDNALNAGGSVQSINVTGTSLTPAPAYLNAPTSGILGASPNTFTWNPGVGVSQYQLLIGSTVAGSSNLFNSGLTTSTSALVTTIPAGGGALFVRLSSLINGTWQYTDYQFVESGVPSPATMVSPSPGLSTILSSPTTTFTWTPGAGVTQYQLLISTLGNGLKDVYTSYATSATSATAAIPANGALLYVTVASEINGVWISNYYLYTEPGTSGPAGIVSPAPSTTLGSGSITFNWSAGNGPTEYIFYLGTTGVGSNNLYNSGGTHARSASVTIPAYGVTVYARLYSLISGVWTSNDYVYTESGTPTPAALLTPAPGTVLGTGPITFTWSPGGGPTEYILYLGTTGVGSKNVYNSGGTVATSATSPAVPTSGATVYVRLYSLINGAWQSIDYTYIEP